MFRGFDDDPFFRDFNNSVRGGHNGAFNNAMSVQAHVGAPQGNPGNHGPAPPPGRHVARPADIFSSFFPNFANIPHMRNIQQNMQGIQQQIQNMQAQGQNAAFVSSVAPPGGQNAAFVTSVAGPGGRNMQAHTTQNANNGYSFSSSQVYSYRQDGGGGAPEEYQAMSQMAAGPHGVRETKKGYKDSRTETQKMQYGRHIGQRGTVQERSRVRQQHHENTDYIGFAEPQAPQFDREWREKAAGLYHHAHGQGVNITHRPRHGGHSALPPSGPY